MLYGKKEKRAMCEYCENLVAAGEGDYICNECSQPVMPISEYTPTDEYLECGGRKYKKN